MSYYLLPYCDLHTYKYLEYKSCETNPSLYISESLAHYLYDMKAKIDDNDKKWDIYKKYTNPYEYIHTVIPYKHKCIAKHKPLSRSYFKMIEICNTFSLLEKYKNTVSLQTFHLAEGPGGFIEAIARTRKNKQDKYVGMTLQADENSNIPGWKKTGDFLSEFPNVYLENGMDGTGNILSLENFDYVRENYKNIDIVTGDGGFDFSTDFNKQESSIVKLLYAQICYALSIQKRGGIFILKIFDAFMKHTIDLLYLLSSFYKQVYILKPNTSRYANSEKYIVCIGFLFDNKDSSKYVFYLRNTLEAMLKDDALPHSFLKMPPSYYFIQKIEEYNSIFGQKQMQNIQCTMSLIEHKNKYEKIEMLMKINIKKCIEWCIRHNIDYFSFFEHSNIFLPFTHMKN